MRKILLFVKFLFTFAGLLMTFLYDVIRNWAETNFGWTANQVDSFGIWFFIASVTIFMTISTIQDFIKEANRPKIIAIGKPIWHLKGFTGNQTRKALYIEFKNTGGDVARHVHAIVKWKSQQGKATPENNGRWHITNRQIELGHPLQSIDMYPNEEAYGFHFGIKSPDGKDMYAWYRVKDEHGETFKLEDKSYYVEITLTDNQHSKWKFEYPIENDQQNIIEEQKISTTSQKANLKRKTKKTQKVNLVEDSPIPLNKSSVLMISNNEKENRKTTKRKKEVLSLKRTSSKR